MKLEGKVAIVTGASRGLGKAFALDFAKERNHPDVVDLLRKHGATE